MKRKMTQPVTRWVFSAQFQVTKYLDIHEKNYFNYHFDFANIKKSLFSEWIGIMFEKIQME